MSHHNMSSFDSVDWEWIRSNIQCKPLDLSLKYGKDKKFEILQIDCRNRCKNKLPSFLIHPHFIFPSLLLSQQSSSDRTASFHGSLISPGGNILDMTAGLAIDTFALARKASKVIAIDISSDNIAAAIHNASILNLHNIEFICSDSISWLEKNDISFDTVFIDPARRDNYNRKCYSLKDCQPDVLTLLPLLRLRCRQLIIKMSPMLDIVAVTKQLPNLKDLYVVGTRKECKELLAVVDFGWHSYYRLHAVTLIGDITLSFQYTESSPNTLQKFAEPAAIYNSNGFIYLPYPSLMKAGCFSFIAQTFQVEELARHTHLFYSHKEVSEFPGEIFRIIRTMPYDKKSMRNFNKLFPEITITAKNFPLTSEQLKGNLKTKDSESLRLFAVTLSDNTKTLIVTEPCSESIS